MIRRPRLGLGSRAVDHLIGVYRESLGPPKQTRQRLLDVEQPLQCRMVTEDCEWLPVKVYVEVFHCGYHGQELQFGDAVVALCGHCFRGLAKGWHRCYKCRHLSSADRGGPAGDNTVIYNIL